MGSRSLFDGQPLPSRAGDPFAQVPGSMGHLASPLFDPAAVIPDGADATVADRNWYTVRVEADGTMRSVLTIVKGERVDPAQIEAIKAEQYLFGLVDAIAHERVDGRRPVSANPKEDTDIRRDIANKSRQPLIEDKHDRHAAHPGADPDTGPDAFTVSPDGHADTDATVGGPSGDADADPDRPAA